MNIIVRDEVDGTIQPDGHHEDVKHPLMPI